MAFLDANHTWFNFKVINEEERFGNLSVYAFSGSEELNKPFEFSIELVTRDRELDLTRALGKEGLLTIADRSGGKRHVHGVTREFEQLHTSDSFTHYRCKLVPRVWFLGQTQDHKIYQHKSVPEIIEDILKKHVFVFESYSFKLFNKYQPREYCVQYGESDLYFINRLCEEEGLAYYFEHTDSGHCFCLTDVAGGGPIPGERSIRFFPGSGAMPDTAVISRLNLKKRINSDYSTYRDWNFTAPKVDLTSKDWKPEWSDAPTPLAMSLETYQFPHLYQIQTEGERYARIQLQRQLTFREWVEGESDVCRYMPGHVFDLHSHTRDDANRTWFLVGVSHEGKQPGVLEQVSPDRGHEYKSAIIAIPSDIRYVPEVLHPKKRIEGVQSAIVTGSGMEEIFVDKYGRIKVQFHWDRLGQADENTTCWVRVSQGWAGGQYGGMAIPRVGHEVVVSFLEGDPDRPLITGRVYNAANMPPYSLPEHKSRMTIKSKTQHGTGFNELRFEDLKGSEQIFLHAERDYDIIVNSDRKEWIKNDRHLLVGRDRVEEVKGVSSSQVDGERIEATAKKRTVTVGEDEAHQVGGSYHHKVEKNIFIEGMTNGVVQMHEELTLKAPGGFIHIDKTGVTIVGKVINLNSGGAAGTGFPVQAGTARSAELADARDGLTGKAGTVKGAQKAPEYANSKNDSQAEAPFNTFGGQTFDTSLLPSHVAPPLIGAASTQVIAEALRALNEQGLAVEILKPYDNTNVQEWSKAVAEAKLEQTVAGKIDVVDSYFSRSQTLMEQGEEIKSLKDVVLSGSSSNLERAVAHYQTLEAAGVPPDSMRVMVTEQNAFVAVADRKQSLVAGAGNPPGMPCRTTASMHLVPEQTIGLDAKGAHSYASVVD